MLLDGPHSLSTMGKEYLYGVSRAGTAIIMYIENGLYIMYRVGMYVCMLILLKVCMHGCIFTCVCINGLVYNVCMCTLHQIPQNILAINNKPQSKTTMSDYDSKPAHRYPCARDVF